MASGVQPLGTPADRPGSSSDLGPSIYVAGALRRAHADVEQDRLLATEGLGLGSLFAGLKWPAHASDDGGRASHAAATLGLMWESTASAPERELLCECIRDSGSVEHLVMLSRHPEVKTVQAALLVLARMVDGSSDCRRGETIVKLKRCRAVAHLASCLNAKAPFAVLHAMSILQPLCREDLEQVRVLYEAGAITRLRELTRCASHPQIASEAAACLDIVMGGVRQSKVSLIVTRAVVRVQARVRRLQARRRYATTLRAVVKLQALARTRKPKGELRVLRAEKAAYDAQVRAEREAIIMLKLRLSGPLRERLKAKVRARMRSCTSLSGHLRCDHVHLRTML